MDKDAAKILQNGSALNKDLLREENPLVVLFESGHSNNKQGYWSYKHLVIHIEYSLDCLKVLYPSFD